MGVFGTALSGSIASSLGGSIGGFPGNVSSGLFSIGAQKRQYRYQKKLMDRQYNQQLDFWNKQNEYNSPAAQVGRLTDANLNPHLMYSNGDAGMTASNGQLSSSPAAGMASTPDFSGPSGNPTAIGQLRLMEAQANVARSQAASNDAQATYFLAQAAGTGLKNKFFKETWDTQVENLGLVGKEASSRIGVNEQQVANLRQSISLMKAQEALSQQQKDTLAAEAAQIRTLTPWRVKEIWSNIQKNDADIRRSNVLNGLTEYQVADIAQSWSKIGFEIDEITSKIDLNRVMEEYLPKEFVRRCVETGANVLDEVLKLVGAVTTRGASLGVPSPANPVSRGRAPMLYGADGKPISYLTW